MAVQSETSRPSPSQRIETYPQSVIRGLSPLATKAKDSGIEVISLNLGGPDTATPEVFRQAGQRFFDRTESIGYGASEGNPRLIEAMCAFYEAKLGISGINQESLLVTEGGSEAIRYAFLFVTDPGENVLVLDPGYANYRGFAHELGVELRPIPTSIDNGFHLLKPKETHDQAVARISALVNNKTKAILWSSPGNPTGTVLSHPELQVLSDVATQKGLFLIADEVYRLLVFEGGIKPKKLLRAPSIFDLAVTPEQRKNIIGIDSTSKMASYAGGRIGFMIIDSEFAPLIINAVSNRGCASTVSQSAVEAINNVPIEYFLDNRQEFLARRNLTFQGFQQLYDLDVKVSVKPPEGGFYIPVDLGSSIPAAHFCHWLLTDYWQDHGRTKTIFFTPMRTPDGAGFYLQEKVGLSQVRVAYVVNQDKLALTPDILRDAILTYRQSQGI